MIGNSDGRLIARDLGIPLVRVGFPVYDRVGYQRIPVVGYHGAVNLLNRITNTVLRAYYEHSTGNSSSKQKFPETNLENSRVCHMDTLIETLPSRREHFKRSCGEGGHAAMRHQYRVWLLRGHACMEAQGWS